MLWRFAIGKVVRCYNNTEQVLCSLLMPSIASILFTLLRPQISYEQLTSVSDSIVMGEH
jgi:hypothetical protein